MNVFLPLHTKPIGRQLSESYGVHTLSLNFLRFVADYQIVLVNPYSIWLNDVSLYDSCLSQIITKLKNKRENHKNFVDNLQPLTGCVVLLTKQVSYYQIKRIAFMYSQFTKNSCNTIDYRYNHIFSKVQFLHFEFPYPRQDIASERRYRAKRE